MTTDTQNEAAESTTPRLDPTLVSVHLAQTLSRVLAVDEKTAAEATVDLEASGAAAMVRIAFLRDLVGVIDAHHLTDELAHEGYDGDGMLTGDVTIPDWLRSLAADLLPKSPYSDPQDLDPDGPAPRFPHVRVRLLGEDGNGFNIVMRVSSALKEAGVPSSDRDEFSNEAMSGDYSHLLKTVRQWVTVTDFAV